MHPALQWLFLLARMPRAPVGGQVAGATDHEGLASPCRHDLFPLGLFALALHVQVGSARMWWTCTSSVDPHISHSSARSRLMSSLRLNL